jgi:hypothetical protein
VIANARPAQMPVPHRQTHGARNRFGYFGNLNPWKGVLPLLQAAKLLRDEGGAQLRTAHPWRRAVPERRLHHRPRRGARRGRRREVTHCGPYRRDEMPALMAEVDWVVMPSIWYENAPSSSRKPSSTCGPVIASNIGGMAEMVRDDVDGLHARPGDPAISRRCCGAPRARKGSGTAWSTASSPHPAWTTARRRTLPCSINSNWRRRHDQHDDDAQSGRNRAKRARPRQSSTGASMRSTATGCMAGSGTRPGRRNG